MSRSDRERVGTLETLAREAKELGMKALSEIAGHSATCAERQKNVERRLGMIEKYAIGILLGMLGAILLGIAEHKGLF